MNPTPAHPQDYRCGLKPAVIKMVAWLCVVIQCLFPVATTAGAGMAAARTVAVNPGYAGDIHTVSEPPLTGRTRPYVLGPLESAQSVADRSGLTLTQLRQLNQFRTFARGFDNVRQGDEIDVPAAPQQAGMTGRLSPSADRGPGAEPAARVAGAAQQAGTLLTQGLTGKQASGMARGHVAGAASSAVNDWLGQFGTARITLNTDEKLSLKGSQADLLLAWYETPENLFFTQHSFHRTDDRNQLNTGMGWRHFTPSYMAGVNLFYDHDLTRYHSRLGLGAEYWRDYLKLSGNGYLRLSNWRSAPELSHDYEARPANGWDVRAEGWLPGYPQVGGKLVFEQYYGDEVALFGKDKRQKDPHAFTAGLSYTPFPLLTVSAEQRQGKGGENDTRFGIGLTWQAGMSLAQHLDPDGVAARRSLAGSRHDLVERNNNIVLEYRKKALVKLKLHDPVSGKPGDSKSLVSSLQTKYALKALHTEAETLTAAGGSYSVSGSQVTVTLPDYRYTETAITDNTYVVSVTAEDEKGNRSSRERATVVVEAPVLNPGKSTITAEPSSLPADGKSQAAVTFMALDGQSKGIPGLKPVLKPEAVQGAQTGSRATVSALKDEGDGRYTGTLTAGTSTEKVRLIAELNGQAVVETAAAVTVDAGEASES
ncbi:inverse autotransporter beta domain-containing protein, partial [Enterobacter ludwigii]|uniref:inverse autotransporter beta domain-containing protein n=1 Tax=Enterobacter ludwigii TaxID=299767 RepID=UPI0039755223